MNMFARFDENPAMNLRVIKETKRYGRTDAHTHGRTTYTHHKVCGGGGIMKTVYPPQTKIAGGIKSWILTSWPLSPPKGWDTGLRSKITFDRFHLYCTSVCMLNFRKNFDNLLSYIWPFDPTLGIRGVW